MATTAKATISSTKILLLCPKATTENVNLSVTVPFTLLSAMTNYVIDNIKTTDTFILVVPDDVKQDLVKDLIYSFPQVQAIHVYCTNYNYQKQDENYIQDELKKIRYFHERHLQEKIANIMDGNASSASISIDRTKINDKASSHEQRISAKRSKPSSSYSLVSKRFATTSKHGFVVKNIEQIELSHICPMCKLVLREPYQLDCGHRTCQPCLKIKNNGMTCLVCFEVSLGKDIWFDRGFRNEMQQVSLCCSVCDWTGSLKFYQEHIDQTHPDREYGTVTPGGINQQVEYTAIHEEIDTPEMILSNNRPFSHLNYAPINNDGRPNLLSETQDQIAIMSYTLNNLKNDQTRLINALSHSQNSLEVIAHNLSSDKVSLEENIGLTKKIQSSQDLCRQEMWSLQQGIQDRQVTSFDGSLIWKIICLDEKIADAKSERQKSIYSPPFYSSQTGYKMCLRLYLNGDDDVRGTHLSLFLVIMRGDYDAILTWPFPYKITFDLLAQSTVNGNRCDITGHVWSDTTSKCFQRPICDMNDAYGIKRFFSLEQFKRYLHLFVKDGIIFIKATVDFSSERPESLATAGTGDLPNDEEHVGSIEPNFAHIG